jgi:TatD DNase family protein
MPLHLVDTHCHLDLAPLSASIDAVLQRAQAAGVRWCVSIGTGLDASRANVALARAHAMVRAAVGVHPNSAEDVTDEVMAQIESLAGEPGVVAIGEVGLDQYRRSASPAAQARALKGFIAIAKRWALPLLIHCRDAYAPLIELLQRESSGAYRGIIHCASGPPEFIRETLALGFHISFAGNVTFPNAGALRALVPLVPDDRLLIETDAPFLAPQPVRGQPNEPGYVAHTAAHLAGLRGVTMDALGLQTTRNAARLFGMPEPSG